MAALSAMNTSIDQSEQRNYASKHL